MTKKKGAGFTVTSQVSPLCSLLPNWQNQRQPESNAHLGKTAQLEAMCSFCRVLGAEVCYNPLHRYFTAMIWDGWDAPYDEGPAFAVQQKIQQQAAQYPDLVCYCFDPFSTLIYAI